VLLALALLGLRWLGYVELRVLVHRLREAAGRPRRRLISSLVTVARAGDTLAAARDLPEVAERLRLLAEESGFTFLAIRWSDQARATLSVEPVRAGSCAEATTWEAGQPPDATCWVFAPGDDATGAPAASVCWSLPLPRETGRYGTLVVQRGIAYDEPGPAENDLLRWLAEPLTVALMALEARRAHVPASP
jgi:hypothetical protein